MAQLRKLGYVTILLSLLFSSVFVSSAAAAPQNTEIFAEGELCTETYGMVFCFPLTFMFIPEGGPVYGESSGTTSYPIEGVGTIVSSFKAVFEGTFYGGDGGTLEGTWSSTANVTLPDGLSMPSDMSALMQSSAGGTWSGNLYADGTGSGTFQSSDFSGGSWQVSYSGSAFELAEPTATTAAPEPTATTAPPTAVPPTPTTTASPGPTLDADALLALGDLQSAIQRKMALIQSGGETDHPAVISPWLYGQMVRVELEDEQPFVLDLYGHRVEVDENGLPQSDPSVIESPSADIVNAHPDLDWPSLFDSMSETAYNAFSNFTEPTFQFLEQATEGIEPTEIADGFFGFLNQLSSPPDDKLSPDESTVVKTEAALQETNKKLAEQQVEASDSEKIEVQEAVDEVEEEEEYTWRKHYVEVLETISAEDWDRMVSQGIDPVQLMRNKKTADETLVKFNQFFGNQSISDLADKFDLVPDEVNAMKAKLNALGVDPHKAEELAQATLALRVITELASDHTVSSDGYFDKVVWAFSFLAINKASQDALMDELDGKVELTPAQIDLIMENRGSGIIEALTGQQDPEDDPLLSALISEITKRAVQ